MGMISEPNAPQPDTFEMVRRVPCEALNGIVSAISGYRENLRGHYRQRETASLTVPLVISFGAPFSIGLGGVPGHNDRVASFAAGLFAGPVVIDSFGQSCCVQIDFTPLGARRFFRMPMRELTARMVDLGDVLGPEGQALRERLGNTPDWEPRLKLAERFVLNRVAEAQSSPSPVAWAFGQIVAKSGSVSVAKLAARIGWSRKHLASRFDDEIGLGPKALSRIVRFRRVLGMSGAETDAGWADLAAACGYSDQAHLAREFRALAGVTPSEWRSQR